MKIKNQIKTILNNQSGLTLLELLLVVTILSTVAFMTLSVVENGTDQIRFEDTRNRFGTIRTAIVGETSPVFNGQRLLSGFVAENGVLPGDNGLPADDLADLWERPEDLVTPFAIYDEFRLRIPQFDSDPNADGINNGTGTADVPVPGDGNQLFKGYRNGGYIMRPPGSDTFRDGWGNDWTAVYNPPSVGPPATFGTFETTTPGKNNDFDVADVEYERDVLDEIEFTDWQVDASGLTQVSVTNSSGADITAPGGSGCFRVSLLVYINTLDAPAEDDLNWKRLTSDCIVIDPLVNGTSYDITFPPEGGGTGAFQPPTLIPQGEHLLVLVQDSDGTDAHNDGSETLYDSDTLTAGIQPIATHVNFYARAALPSAELVIR